MGVAWEAGGVLRSVLHGNLPLLLARVAHAVRVVRRCHARRCRLRVVVIGVLLRRIRGGVVGVRPAVPVLMPCSRRRPLPTGPAAHSIAAFGTPEMHMENPQHMLLADS